MGKNVVITGGSSGIGRAVTEKLLEGGHTVHVLSRKASQSDLVSNSNYKGHDVDVREIEQIPAAVEGIEKVDVLINCAGVGYGTPLANLSQEDYDKIIDTNLKGTVFVTKLILPKMNGGGVICNFSSSAGIAGFTEWTVYCASKFAIEGFSKALREEVRDRNIKVMVVRPGAVDTPLYNFLEEKEKKDFMKPETVADVVVANLFLEKNAVMEEVFINNSIGFI